MLTWYIVLISWSWYISDLTEHAYIGVSTSLWWYAIIVPNLARHLAVEVWMYLVSCTTCKNLYPCYDEWCIELWPTVIARHQSPIRGRDFTYLIALSYSISSYFIYSYNGKSEYVFTQSSHTYNLIPTQSSHTYVL